VHQVHVVAVHVVDLSGGCSQGHVSLFGHGF
jgi:hypothetical protein